MGSRRRAQSPSSVNKTSQWQLACVFRHAHSAPRCGYKRRARANAHQFFAEEPRLCPGRTAVVQQLWRRDVTSPFPPSGNGGYASNRDVPYQSVTFDVTSEWLTNGILFLLRGRGGRSVRSRACSLEGTLHGSTVFKVARRAGWWYILVAQLENTIAPGRQASDFARLVHVFTERKKNWIREMEKERETIYINSNSGNSGPLSILDQSESNSGP